MTKETKAQLIEKQIVWIEQLCSKIREAHEETDHADFCGQQSRGAINNLCPELSKAASKLRKLIKLFTVN
jgi:hypothetical protein